MGTEGGTPFTASALAATITDPSVFKSGRELAAWIGLVPRQTSTGGKERMGRISKQGDHYLRWLLVACAMTVIRHAKRRGTADLPWLADLNLSSGRHIVVGQDSRSCRAQPAEAAHANRQDEAIAEAEQARAIDPLSLAVNVNLGWQYLQAGRLEQARRLFESTAELNHDFWSVHWGLGHYYRQSGRYDEAIAAFRKAVDAGGGFTLPLKALGYTYAVSGRSKQAREILDRLVALAEERYVSPFNMATIHVGLGENDEAFAWLDKAYDMRSRSLVWLNVAKEYDGLRTDPRFKSLLRRIGLPE